MIFEQNPSWGANKVILELRNLGTVLGPIFGVA